MHSKTIHAPLNDHASLAAAARTMQVSIIALHELSLIYGRSVAWVPRTAQLRTAHPAVVRRASAIQAGARNGAPARSALSTSAAPSLASAERPRTSVAARRSRSRAALAGRAPGRESSDTMRGGRRPRSAMEVRIVHQASPFGSSTDLPVVIEVL